MRRLAFHVAIALALLGAMLAPDSRAGTTYELNIVSLAPKGTPWSDLLDETEHRLETKSGGRIQVTIRPPSTMSEQDMVREVRSGERLQGCGVTIASLASAADLPVLQIVELPFLFDSNEAADYVMDKVMVPELTPMLADKGLVLEVLSENGWHSFATRTKPIHTPDDMVGLKMRAQESDVYTAMVTAFGGTPVPMPAADVPAALKSGTIDGIDNTALYIQAGGLAEQLKYYTLTRHTYQPAVVVWSKAWVDKLPSDLQAVVSDLADLTPKGRAAIRAEEQQLIDNFSIFGVEVIDLTPEQRQAFATKGKAMHEGFAKTIPGGPELLAKIDAALAEQAKGK
jgi:TRAP-type C4-dicarboxylate transport system substrate-binding protein